ncbi:MAG: aminotransferase class I/II-fold pyridoxal phosphate-dependent enzyme [Bacillota bacterium]|nr:aminotransferase class I/II-fold pyridoxal phosphate-dependent enzyme [Bacillota bacterium]
MSYKIKDYIKDYSSDSEIKSELAKRLSEYFESRYCYPVSNGTVAIEIALKALDIPRGSCVIVPDISFIATATAVANCGLVPVFADVSKEHFGLTLNALKSKLNKNTRAVIVVHLGGFVNREILEIKDFCKSNGLYLIEDCAQAFSSSVSGKKVGTIGDVGTYSLQASKLINCGEGGFILTDDAAIQIKCEMISNWGYSPEYRKFDSNLPSSNFRLSAVQSYLVLKQLSMVDEIIKERLDRVAGLKEAFNSSGIATKIPMKEEKFFDCPFYLPVESQNKINTIEPRAEYPMRKSNIVKAILNRFFPDLLEAYNEYNKDAGFEWSSDKLLCEVDLINISQKSNLSAMEIIKEYIDNQLQN